ncbi:MAG: rhamnan synthesis F family protein [Aurantimonas endophytica]|uniref:rhamnan synthesis F family protein n=1 Tax=Aurantimonas endophytica TaxID=1522175 RepID=UPI0030017885
MDEGKTGFMDVTARIDVGEEIHWQPHRLVFPGNWAGHIPFAFWLTKVLRPGLFVELGTHTGNSYSAFCQAISHFGTTTRAFAVDSWQGDAHADYYGNEVFVELEDYNRSNYAAFSTLMRMMFDDARPYFSEGSVDLLHIDGLHTYEAVKADFDGWQEKLSGRGVVLFHDTNVRERDFGVWKLWSELSQRHPSFEFTHSHGLGVLGVGDDMPNELRALFEISGDEAGVVRRLFERPGELLLQRSRLIEMTQHYTKLNAQLRQALDASEGARAHLQHEHQWVDQLLHARHGVLLARDKLLEEREIQLRARDAMVRESKARHEELLAEVRQLRASVSSEARQPAAGTNQIEELERRLKEAQDEILKLSGSYAALRPPEIDVHSELDAVHRLYQHSASWRVTKPLRLASRVLRGERSAPPSAAPSDPARTDSSNNPPAGLDPVPQPMPGGHTSKPAVTERPDSQSGLKASLRTVMENRLRAFLTGSGRLVLPHGDNPDVSIILVLFNQADLTYSCLGSIVEVLTGSALKVEIIILDNGSSDRTSEMLERVDGATIIRSEENLHFLRGVNAAAAKARGRHLLLLNNDADLVPGSMERAVEILDADPTVGAVGGRIILPDGTLQEAGSIIFSDGSCLGYGRSQRPDDSQFMFQRDVDFCSGAFLMTPRALFESHDRFDLAYAPAYYEETDYCVRLRKDGLRIVYDPGIVILHFEFGSSAASEDAMQLQQQNWATFRRAHGAWLARQLPPGGDPATLLAARNALDGKPNVLMIEDRIPHRQLGSGYPRSRDLVCALDERSHLTFFPMFEHAETWPGIRKTVPATVEVVKEGSSANLREFLLSRRGSFDAVLVARPHNMAVLTDIIEQDEGILGGAKVIYDAEAIFARRELLQSAALGQPAGELDQRMHIAKEVALTRYADAVIAVSEDERRTFVDHGISPVTTVGHAICPHPTDASFDQRPNLLFLGPAHDDSTPNADSLRWFAEAVLPKLREKLDENVRLRIVGIVNAPSIRSKDGLEFDLAGRVEDLEHEMNKARVVVVPTRFAAGLPFKAQEVASYGVPMVATELIANQLAWTSGSEIFATNDPDQFAAYCAQLFHDETMWNRLRFNALERVKSDCSPARFEAGVDEALSIVEPRDERSRAVARLLQNADEEKVLPRYVGRPAEEDYSLAVPFDYRPEPSAARPAAAAVIHAYYPDLVPEILRYIRNVPFPIDLFISTDTEEKKAVIEKALEGWVSGSAEVRVFPNRGRDIAPKIVGFADVYDRYEFVVHLHSKASLHDAKLAPWRRYLYETLLGSPAIVASVMEAFDKQPSIGLAAPQHYDYIRRWLGWENNFAQARRVAARMGVSLSPEQALDFPSGSMFWARSAALKPILDMNLSFADFPDEADQTDGTLAHVIERLYFYAAESAGFAWLKVARPEFLIDSRTAVTIGSSADLDRFVKVHTPSLTGPVRLAIRADAPAVLRDLPPAVAALATGEDKL